MTPRNLFPRKVSTEAFIIDLQRVLRPLVTNPAVGKIFVVIDQDYTVRLGGQTLNVPKCEFITPQKVTPAFLAGLDPAKIHFVYAVECSSDGLAAIELIVQGKFKYTPTGGAPVGPYAYENSLAMQVVERQFVYQTLAGYSKFEDPGTKEDFLNLCQALDTTRDVPGDVVEVGCFRGSSSSVLLDYAKASGSTRQFWFFDTFDGFSYEAARTSSDAMWQGTHQTEGLEVVRNRLRAIGYEKMDIRRMNIITDELPEKIGPIAVANVDVDLYDAVKAGLFKVEKHIPSGGVIICEDAGHTPNLIGARLALQEFMRSGQGRRFTQIFMPSGQAFLVAR